MTEENDDPQGTPKRFDLSQFLYPFDIETDHTGPLRVSSLTFEIMTKIEPLLSPAENISEGSLARTLMSHMVKHQPSSATEECAPLTEVQLEQLTEMDVRRFAEGVLIREGGKVKTNETAEALSPEIQLAHFLHERREKIAESMQRWTKALGPGWLSMTTQSLLGNQKLQSEKIKSLFNTSDCTHQFGLPFWSFAQQDQFADTARLHASIRDNSPAQIIRDKMDKLIGIGSFTLQAIDCGTNLNQKLLAVSVEKIKKDACAQRTATWCAVIGIAFTIVIGGLQLFVSCQSNSHNLAVEANAAEERTSLAPKEEKRLQLMREQLAAQQEQNKLLREQLTAQQEQNRLSCAFLTQSVQKAQGKPRKE